MLEDGKAFGIGSTIVGVVQFVIGASSIAVLNFAAQKQVIKTLTNVLSSKTFNYSEQLCCVD